MGDIFENIIKSATSDEEPDYGTFNTDNPEIKEVNKDLDEIPEDKDEEPEKGDTGEVGGEEDKEPEAGKKEEGGAEEGGEEEKGEKEEEKELPKWALQLPRRMREDKEVQDLVSNFRTIGDLVDYVMRVETEMMDMVKLPGENATEEEIKEFYEQIGVPESPDQYAVEHWKDPEGNSFDGPVRDAILEAMHEAKLSKSQAQHVYSKIGEILAKKMEIEKEELEEKAREAEEYFRIKWGARYQKNMSDILDVIHKYGGAELVDEIDRSGLGNNIDFIKFLYNVAKNFASDTFVEGEIEGPKEPHRRILSYPSMEE